MEKNESHDLQPVYLHVYPFRAVRHYSHIYTTFAKGRWLNKPLLQTLVKQFKAYDEEYYENAIISGNIKINSKKVNTNYIIKSGDKLVHETIRTQPPVLDLEVQIVEQNEQYVVVNKPPSLTIHTGGGFHYNTLISIMEHELKYKGLYVLHRLDRLTSGLIIFAKNKQKPQVFHQQNLEETMKKMYYARVTGNFKWQEKTLCASIQCVSFKDGIYKVHTELKEQELNYQFAQIKESQLKIKVEQKVKQKKQQKQPKLKQLIGNGQAQNAIKQSKTIFKKVWYDEKSDSSLLECYPISGRTHQIRVHLQHLGFPILNDVVYGGKFVGNWIIKQVKKQSSINQKNKKQSKQQQDQENQKKQPCKKIKTSQLVQRQQKLQLTQQKIQMSINNTQTHEQIYLNSNKFWHEAEAQMNKKLNQSYYQSYKNQNSDSLRVSNSDFDIQKWDYKERPWQIFLHSYEYKLQEYVFRTKKPYWFNKDY